MVKVFGSLFGALAGALRPPDGDEAALCALGLGRVCGKGVAVEHRALFGLGGPAVVSPYEGAHRQISIYELLETYAEAGLEPDPGFRDRPDHVSAELSFLDLLTRDAATGAAESREAAPERASILRDAFLQGRALVWMPGFFSALERVGGFPLHRRLGRRGRAVLRRESARLLPGVTIHGGARPYAGGALRCTSCGDPLPVAVALVGVPVPSGSSMCAGCRVRSDLERVRP